MLRTTACLLCLVLTAPLNLTAAEESGSPSGKLRKPGFLFLELRVADMASYENFLHDVLGFQTAHAERDFMTLETSSAQILLSGGLKPQADRKFGTGVEIGIAVDDLDAAFAKVAEHKQWRVASKIQKQPWGVRDFRVFAPDGYYIRITEPPRP